MTAEVPVVAPSRRSVPRWIVTVLAVIFGLFFAYDAWEAVGNVIGISMLASGLDTSISVLGWVVLIVGIIVPVAVFLIAFFVGRRRDLIAQILLYLTGLGVSAVIALDIVALFGAGQLLT
jgi:TRAP-type C4-dicarboxylate transport system permease small subunit